MSVRSSLDFSDLVFYDRGLPGEKLNYFIDQFVAAATEDPFTSWLLLPTKRLVVDVTGYLTAHNIPFIVSRICNLEGFCQILFEDSRTTERLLSKGESKLLLNDILEKHADEIPLFITRDHPSPGTIDDLMTFMNVTLTRKTAFPECLLSLQSEKSDQLDTIITEYRNRLRKLELVDGDTILEWTIDHLDRCASSPLGTVFIYGFHEPLPLEQDLFDTIKAHAGNAYFFFPDGLDPNIFRSRTVEGKQPVSQPAPDPLSIRSEITGLFLETGTLKAGDFFRVQTFPSRYAEVYGIAAEIGRLNAAGTPLADIAVVFPDLRGDYGLIEEVFKEFLIPWNAAVGPKLSRAPVIQILAGIAGLVSGGYNRENIIRLIGSPYFRKEAVPGGTSRLDAGEVDLVSRYARIDGSYPSWIPQLDWLHNELQDPEKSKNYPGIPVHTVERVQEGMRILIRDLDALAGKKSLRVHISGFLSFLKSWNIPRLYTAPDEQTNEREIKAYNKFTTRLEALAMAAWIPEHEPVPYNAFLRFISAIAEEPDQSGRQDTGGVAVLGLRECPHLKFPYVFIGGLVEGTFPRLTTRLPFTNSLENSRMGTRTLYKILREEQYYFIAALLSAQKTVYLSAPLADGEKPLLTSAFFERVRMRTKEAPWPDATGIIPPASRRTAAVLAGAGIRDETICVALSLIPGSLDISDLVERINMERYYRRGNCDSPYDGILSDESIREVLAERYGPEHVYSPTSLETYASCPFEYFLNRVINLQALPEVEPNLSAGDRGTAIHDILSTFYRKWRSAGQMKVSLASLSDATDLILRLANEELDKYSFQSPLWDATRILMLGDRHTGPGYFERFLLHETDESASPLVPSLFEYSFGMGTTESDDPASSPSPVELTSPDGERKVFIRGRIDRIDLTPDGFFLIYDYKSGSQHPRAKDIEAGTALQLPLYLLAFEKITGNHGIGGGYYTIRREVDRSIVLADSAAKDLMVSRPRVSKDFAGMIQHSRDCAFEYIDGIRNGRFPLPCEEKCPNLYCEFKRICRFDPYRVFEVREET
ncbi:MAG: PD-(D/E)XK nuclease family protein [Methanoregula sp.]|nr:PD-(D/E)XK nuclease family protein [Methanoregula sp.]